MASEKADVAVVGGGVIGASATYHLAREKVKVTILEHNALGNGASFHSGGGIVRPPRV